MFDMSQVDLNVLYALLKGEPGTKKSTSALSFPRPQFWLSFDRKMEALLLPMKHWGINPKDIHYEDYDNWSIPKPGEMSAKAKLESLQLNCPYKTIVCDSITSIGDASLRQAMKMKGGTTRASGQAAGKNISGIAVNELEDYNAESAVLSELVALTKDIHKFHHVNIVLIAHVIQADYRSIGGETHISRTIVTAAKKIAAKIPAYCTEVYHFNIKKSFDTAQGGTYALLTEHTGDDFARTALPLPKEIEFGNQPLYDNWLKPAIDKLKQSLTQSPQTNQFTK